MIHILDADTVQLRNLPTMYRIAIQKRLMIDDPTYHKMKAMGSPMYGRDQYFRYYKVHEWGLEIPKGWLLPTLRFLDKHGVPYELERKKINAKLSHPLKSTITLRPYQEPVVEAMLKEKSGVVQMSTGSGKTIVAFECIVRAGMRATIIVKDKTILSQFVESAKEFLGYDVGVCGDGQKEVKDITVATVQTLIADPKLCHDIAQETGVLIVDEIQEFVSEKRQSAINRFAPELFLGMTATPYRSKDDGRTDAIKFIFGDTIATYSEESIKPRVQVYFSGANIMVRAKYNDMIKDMIEHEKRNNLIASLACNEIDDGKKVLILTKRVAHAETIYDTIKNIDGTYLIQSNTKGKASLLQSLKKGEQPYSCLVGTMALLGTGFDVPTLDRLIIAGDLKSNVLTVQSVGRILRILNEKDPVVYDICDEKNGILFQQFRARKKIYDEREWEIEWFPNEIYTLFRKWKKL